MSETTDRLKLPYLAVAQAQKEMTHNEALALLDVATQAVVESVAPVTVPAAPLVGQCWIVGAGAAGSWSGHAGALAGWTGGGWRFLAPFEGMAVWSLADQGWARFAAGSWTVSARGAAIASPSGGTVIDSESRSAIAEILVILRGHGLIAR